MDPTDQNDKGVTIALHEASMNSLDRVFKLLYTTYEDQFEDSEAIYVTFVTVLAQTLGSHIAAFPEEERDRAAADAITIQKEMTDLVLEASRRHESSGTLDPSKEYDLSQLVPAGRA